MHVLDGGDQLKHEISDMLRLERAFVEADGFIKISHGAELEDDEEVGLGLEGIEKAHDMGVLPEQIVEPELLGVIVVIVMVVMRWLGETLDGNKLVGFDIPSE